MGIWTNASDPRLWTKRCGMYPDALATSPTLRRLQRRMRALLMQPTCDRNEWSRLFEDAERIKSMRRHALHFGGLGDSMRLLMEARNGDDVTPDDRQREKQRRTNRFLHPKFLHSVNGEGYYYTDREENPDYYYLYDREADQ